ncbi:TetR/AcrR family transcriptional regulator C-terminal domain-containing protein [Microlunatus speluncae]|uniref:TetR/AcrR family transcriptional regulator C-terminal domain-containing protein n=1 Tax=Microlunatus speluncae TaxID=2594267 RepID=UPI0012662321|nr:TetR/AcrR family transcriptional regulator C-terminal domain-containing protein [Microlunatus speluncae]
MTDQPPYAAIAADLRRRIGIGELRPGDRVPSTRQLARQAGVAMATAAKALTVLRNEGVVVARPRSGTVVAPATAGTDPTPAEGSRPASGSEPTRDRLLQTAVALADAEGLTAVSMRAVAARLGVSPMTLYRHIRDKDDLLASMSDAAFAESPLPTDLPAGWRERIEVAARGLWAVHQRHPWLAHVTPLTRPLAAPSLLAYSELMLAALLDRGLDPITAFDLNVLLYNFVTGIAINLEAEARAAAASGLSDEEWITEQTPDLDALAGSGRYPAFATVLSAMGRLDGGYDLVLDRLFELGLRHLLDGITLTPTCQN